MFALFPPQIVKYFLEPLDPSKGGADLFAFLKVIKSSRTKPSISTFKKEKTHTFQVIPKKKKLWLESQSSPLFTVLLTYSIKVDTSFVERKGERWTGSLRSCES